MMQAQAIDREPRTAPLPLSKREIDRRIGRIVGEVFDDGSSDPARALRPRWISAAEIVRRVGPMLSRN